MKVPPHPVWHHEGNCRKTTPVVMFDGPTAIAKRYCQTCPVVDVCLAHAMANPQELGVWGGLTANERKYRRRNKKAAS